MQILSRIRLKDLMNTNIITIHENTTVSTVIRNYFNVYMKSSFPVTKLDYQIVGLVTLKNCTDVPRAQRNSTSVGDVMFTRNELNLMNIHDIMERLCLL